MRKGQTNTTDHGLLTQYRSTGDLELLGELYNRYVHLVYGVCLKYLKNREQSKDAVTDIFEKLIGEAQNPEIRQFKPWLYVVTKNHCLMQLRNQKTKKKRYDRFLSENIMESTIEMHPVDEDHINLNGQLQKCIDQLNEQQKRCIQMFYFEQKCYRQIAQTLQIDEKKVKSYIQNGKRNLKICLEKGTIQ